uniref:Protein PLASTID MOVEMENT IMPAIRED 2 n=1 Tax=Cajanus cajan TaxID=3821 RepID=A0A151S4U4_CAJCA|nr:Protein PLASTID MOVEMENT IMPAIRED 2 [Cajanus cajan]
MVAKIRQSGTESPNPNPKPEVGEIDTSPPFQSVKDAVSLFGEGAFSGEKPFKKAKPYSAERVLAKETQLHVAQKELNKLREQVKNAETTKAQALVELERAKSSVEELAQKIKVIGESRELAIKATEAAKSQAKQLTEEKLLALKKEFNPELAKNLEMQLAETMSEIGALQKEMENKRTSDLDSVKSVTLELDDAKESLQKVADEESSLRSLVESLKVELENVKREHSELKEKESETESIVGNLHVKLRKSKSELEVCMAEESKVREEAEKKLKVALEEAEAAKAAEASALHRITELTERTTAARASTSESGAVITISKEEFNSLSHKVEESDKLADMKVAAAKAQVEAVKASENEALKRLETTQKEIEDIKSATQEALKKAEMAEAAKRVVESELRRWREREQKKAAEAASRILAETQVSTEPSPQHYRIQKQNPPRTAVEVRKLEKEVSVSKKALLPNISGIFHRKKNQVEGGSPSYLPGENPV